MERSLVVGLTVFRWLAWGWMATVLVLARRNLDHPVPAVLLIAVALLVTIAATLQLRRPDARPLPPWLVAVEVAVAATLQVADGFVYDSGHVFSSEQSLAVAWPLAGVLAAGISGGPWPGLAAGLLMGGGRAVSSLLNLPVGGAEPADLLSLVTTTVLFCLAGGVSGYVVRLLRQAEEQVAEAEAAVADARAREDVARRLHDGVLQTLALVERRSDDGQLAQLAREQENELRDYLFGAQEGKTRTTLVGTGDLGNRLRTAGHRVESAFGLRVDVLVPDDLPALSDLRLEALVGAVGEALTNAGKHARATRATIFVEPADDGVFCSVKDDGIGFEPGTEEGVGLARSIRGRVTEAGGRVEVDGRPGRGAEVRIWL